MQTVPLVVSTIVYRANDTLRSSVSLSSFRAIPSSASNTVASTVFPVCASQNYVWSNPCLFSHRKVARNRLFHTPIKGLTFYLRFFSKSVFFVIRIHDRASAVPYPALGTRTLRVATPITVALTFTLRSKPGTTLCMPPLYLPYEFDGDKAHFWHINFKRLLYIWMYQLVRT